ncbi:LamG-like jellyroll fold domain-containing protein [Lewinella sp. IMCC34191]|uniref:LamG-like jellyroll fold domain-containing protein n=1 Tax=Lewinella sp. IMCC34191 TaxID=2259172 RepID=UPI000E23645D|nr:LamG-like jellyroll fold domain-containing protein [Lewinella sp. IMCC34191]
MKPIFSLLVAMVCMAGTLTAQDFPPPLFRFSFDGIPADQSDNQLSVISTDIGYRADRSGNVLQAAYFNGYSSVIQFRQTGVTPANDFTISGYFNSFGIADSEQTSSIINQYAWFTNQRNFRIGISDNELVALVWDGPELPDRLEIAVPIQDNLWYHYALTVTADNRFLFYLNGCLLTEQQMEGPMRLGSEPIRMGNSNEYGETLPGNDHHFYGIMDEVVMYSSALTTAQIAVLAEDLDLYDAVPVTVGLDFDEGLEADGYRLSFDDLSFGEDVLGAPDSAAYFNGSTSHVTVEGSEAIKGNDFALAAWFYPESLVAGQQSGHLFSQYNWLNGERSLRLSMTDDSLRLHVWYGERYPEFSSAATALTLNEWHQVVVNVTPENALSFYLDSSLVAELVLPAPIITSSVPFRIGTADNMEGDRPGNAHHFRGKIDGFKAYTMALYPCVLEEILTTPESYIRQVNGGGTEEPTSNITAEPADLGIKIFPNPTTGILRLDIPRGEEYTVTVFATSGAAVLTRPVVTGELNLGSLPAGTYLLRLSGPRGTAVERVMKQ